MNKWLGMVGLVLALVLADSAMAKVSSNGFKDSTLSNNRGNIGKNQARTEAELPKYFVAGVSLLGKFQELRDFRVIIVSEMPVDLAQKKAKIWQKIQNELAKLRKAHPEPDPANGAGVFLAWQDVIAKEKEKKLDGLYEDYFAIEGRRSAYLVKGKFKAGQILTAIPSGAVKARKMPKVEKIYGVIYITL